MASFNKTEKNRSRLFDEPICLISTDKYSGIRINEDVMKELRMIKEHLVVVSIIGLYRTGKSFLMNQLFEKMDGFPLGNTIEAKTKGIWIWCKEHPSQDNTVLVLLDTEGIGDPKKGNVAHDYEICTIATLLCNVLVYNVMTAMNQDVIERLAFISEISRKILSENDAFRHIPEIDFLLCIRDFSLSLEINGKEVTEDEYMEDCLRLKQKVDETNERSNRSRACVLKNFTKRKCFVFDRPCRRSLLMELESAQKKDLSPDFIQDSRKFSNYVHSCKPKVYLRSIPVDGIWFTISVREYVRAVRNGAIPDIHDTYTALANIENERLEREAVKTFKRNLEYIKIPTFNLRSLEERFVQIKYSSLKDFRRQSALNSKPYEKSAEKEMESLWHGLKTLNLERVCTSKLTDIYETSVGQNYQRGIYNMPNGFQQYQKDMEEVKRQFKSDMADVDQHVVKQTLIDFTGRQKTVEDKIFATDQAFRTRHQDVYMSCKTKSYLCISVECQAN